VEGTGRVLNAVLCRYLLGVTEKPHEISLSGPGQDLTWVIFYPELVYFQLCLESVFLHASVYPDLQVQFER
jgi:hypothetical protein